MESPIRVLVADDMAPIRDYLSMIIGHESDMEIVGVVESGERAFTLASKNPPDVALMDIEMETPRAGVETIRRLAKALPEIRCVVLTHFFDDNTVFAAFESGAVDYVLKDASGAELLEAVRAAAVGRSFIRPQIARMIRKEFQALRSERSALVDTLNVVYRLTPTELTFLRLLAEGKSKQEIATLRHVESSTIRTHVGNILKKFGEDSVEAVVHRLNRLNIFEVFRGEE